MVSIYVMSPKSDPSQIVYVGQTKASLRARSTKHRYSFNGALEFLAWKKSNDFILREVMRVPANLASVAERQVIKAAIERGHSLFNVYQRS